MFSVAIKLQIAPARALSTLSVHSRVVDAFEISFPLAQNDEIVVVVHLERNAVMLKTFFVRRHDGLMHKLML